MCVWETVAQLAQLKCLSLMGMTLPSAVQPSCVGKCVFVYFCVATMNILLVISFFLAWPVYLHSQVPFFTPSSHYIKRAYLYLLLLTIPIPLRLEPHPINV